MARTLIVSMTANEGDIPYHRLSVARQTQPDVMRVEIAGLSNLEAHRTCYATIMEQKEAFDAFVKLDGDMVFRDATSLGRLISLLDEGTDMVSVPVLDFLTAAPMDGLHVFSPRCAWDVAGIVEPKTDPTPRFPGRHRQFPLRSWAPVLHAHFMTMEQAFAFGLHRGYKCFRVKEGSIGRGLNPPHPMHLATLLRIWRLYQETADPLRGAVMVAAELMRRSAPGLAPFDYKDAALYPAYRAMAQRSEGVEINRFCRRFWSAAWRDLHGAAAAQLFAAMQSAQRQRQRLRSMLSSAG